MKLSSKGRYGIRALFDIAFYNSGRPTQVKDIADRQRIPPRFLEQIFQDLKRAGIVSSKRGPQGGYRLARVPADVRLGDVVVALEGPLALADGVDAEVGEAGDANRSGGVIRAVLDDVSRTIETCLNGVTLADMCFRAESMGMTREPTKGYVYVI